MSEFKIEKGVPIPVIRTKYPWADMEHGDSVLVPWTEGEVKKRKVTAPSAVSAARVWIKSHRPGWKVVARRDGKAHRVWFLDPNHNGDGR